MAPDNNKSSKSKKAQLKIQQMAFVLIAIFIFFAIVALISISVWMNYQKKQVVNLEADKAREFAQKITGTPELKWSQDCSSCVDMDKAIMLKNRTVYKNFFGLDYLSFEILYPITENKECVVGNYPNCNKITLIQEKSFDSASKAYISLCRWDQETNNEKCYLGAIYASGKAVQSTAQK